MKASGKTHKNAFTTAKRFLAGGVNSPVRGFKGLGMDPVFANRGRGKYIFDESGKRYLDFCLSWGPLILGHCHPEVVAAAATALRKGASFGMPTGYETELARMVCECVPSIERIRFVSSGTEAVMTAIRLARGFTKCEMVLKFDGCYHGHSDSVLVSAGSGVAGLSKASSEGIPDGLVRQTLSIPFNDLAVFEKTIAKNRAALAAVIMEPVPANMGLVLPEPGFLQEVRRITQRAGVLLIFDEVITGFRLGLGGAQERLGIVPDLTTLGKVLGGGFPAAAIGGRKDIMARLAPDGDVYQAGTLSGNPVAMSAGIATLGHLMRHPEIYGRMEELVKGFAQEWRRRFCSTINHIGSMFTLFATSNPARNFADAQGQDHDLFRKRFRNWLANGIYMPPSAFETAFVSVRHTKADLNQLLN